MKFRVLLFAALLIAACVNIKNSSPVPDRDILVGKWGTPGDWWTFLDDGTGFREQYPSSHVAIETPLKWTTCCVYLAEETWEVRMRKNDFINLRRASDGVELRLRRF